MRSLVRSLERTEMILHPHRETQRNFLMTIQVIGIRQMTYFGKTYIHYVESNARVSHSPPPQPHCGKYIHEPPGSLYFYADCDVSQLVSCIEKLAGKWNHP
jgi:hypothetical protein